jgi:hypothetical protein
MLCFAIFESDWPQGEKNLEGTESAFQEYPKS